MDEQMSQTLSLPTNEQIQELYFAVEKAVTIAINTGKMKPYSHFSGEQGDQDNVK